MTREEAIRTLRKVKGEVVRGSYIDEVYDMAIEALERVSFENNTEIKSCSKDGDLISRAEAIEAIEETDWYHQNQNKDMVHGANSDEHQAWYKADDVYKALDAVPPADRPQKVIAQITFDEEKLREIVKEAVERFKEEYEITDRPRGRWHYSDGKPATIGQSFGVICDQCGTESEYCTNFCGECGADMRGGDNNEVD